MVRTKPIISPASSDPSISMDKSTKRVIREGLIPLTDIFARDMAMPKAIIPNMSSSATTGKIVLVRGPSARYCLITSNVAAGAVAADIDAITMLKAIKARANSLIISSDFTSDELTILKNDGPRSKPTNR